jgi:uncharacterized membrane protein
MERLKNYGMWLAIAGLIPMFIEALSEYSIFVHLPSNYSQIIIAILGILVLAGIINNPTTQNHWYGEDE